MTIENTKKRNPNLDLIRAVALLLVISSHFLLNTGFYDEIVAGKRMYLMVVIRYLSVTCVPLFLMLTGYLSINKTVSGKYFMRILPTLVYYVLACIACLLFRWTWLGENLNLKIGVLTILDYSASTYGWYVEMYIGLFLLAPFLNLIYHGLKSSSEKKCLLLILIFLTCGPSVLNIFDLSTPGFWTNPSVAVYNTTLLPDWWVFLYPIMYYFIGAFIRDASDKVNRRNVIIFAVLAILLFSSYNYYRSYGGTFREGPWLGRSSLQNMVISVLLFLLLLSIDMGKWPNTIVVIIRQIAELSFVAYLLSAASDKFLYPYLNVAVWSMTERLNYYPLFVVASLVLSLLGAQVIHWVYFLINRLVAWGKNLVR